MSARLKNTPPAWSDPDDAPELTDADFARGTWRIGEKVVTRDAAQAAITQARRGRPPGTVKAAPKVSTTIRLDGTALARWRASGQGWQTRAAAVLAKHAPR